MLTYLLVAMINSLDFIDQANSLFTKIFFLSKNISFSLCLCFHTCNTPCIILTILSQLLFPFCFPFFPKILHILQDSSLNVWKAWTWPYLTSSFHLQM